MNRKLLFLGIAVIVLGIFASSTLFTVHQTQQVIVLQFGDPKRVVSEPGLSWKLPFIQNVQFYEARVLNVDPPVQRVILADQKPLLVDAFARYRITDPLRFFQSVRTEGTAGTRLSTIINASARGVLGNVNLASVLSEERGGIMTQIRDQVNVEARRFGLDVIDVRIRRSDLPDETSQAVYDRMKSEREQEAAEFRAQGFEQSQRIRAAADREATVIRAEAKREAEIQRGVGEGQRTEILNKAYGTDANFFSFYRSMQAYEESLRNNTYMVLSPDGEFSGFFDAIGEGGVRPGQQRRSGAVTDFLTALALVLVIEGLVLAVIPHRLRWLLEQLAEMPPEALRIGGLVSAVVGVGLVWLLRG